MIRPWDRTRFVGPSSQRRRGRLGLRFGEHQPADWQIRLEGSWEAGQMLNRRGPGEAGSLGALGRLLHPIVPLVHPKNASTARG